MISWLERSFERTVKPSLKQWTSPVDPGVYLAALNPKWSRNLTGVIEQITPLTSSAAALRIRPSHGWTGHRPGQFVTIGVDVDGVRHHRCYSLTSSPRQDDGMIEIGVQSVPGGIVSTHLVERARPGDIVQLTPTDGDFTLPAPVPPKLLMISGGSGITPLMGMLRTLADDPVDRRALDVVLLHHAPDAGRAMFATELAHLASAAPWLTIDSQHTQRGGCRLDGTTLESRCPDWREREAFVCGPESLLDVVTDHWESHGLIEQLHLERFASARSIAAKNGGAGARITFETSGRDTVSTDGSTLLELAESAGLSPAHGCRMGICHTCVTPLTSGCARDLRDGRLIEAGTHVRLCVSAPAGDLTLDL